MFKSLFNKRILKRITRLMLCSLLVTFCMAFTVYADGDREDLEVELSWEQGELNNDTAIVYVIASNLTSENCSATGPIFITCEGNVYSSENITEGSADVVIPELQLGEHNLLVEYFGDENYNSFNTSIEVMVSLNLIQNITASDATVAYGDTEKYVNATTDGDGAISYAVKEGSEDYIGVDAKTGALTIKKVPADGKAFVEVTAARTASYQEATEEVTVTITKGTAVPATVTANNRLRDGTEKPLVTVTGTATGEGMQYALGSDDKTEPTSGWGKAIPAKTEAGTYYVWYKAVGNENYNDSKAAVVTVTIKPTVTVTFDSNGGSKVAPQTISKGDKAEEPEEPEYDDYVFIGWFVEPTMENLYDFDNDKINSFDFSSAIEKDTKLTAVWTAFARVNTIGTGKVNYAYEGEEKDDEYDDSIILSAIQGMADTFILTAKADEGSRFVKWQKVIEEGETVEDSTFEDYSEDEEITIKITEPISLVAVFETIDEDDKEYSSYESDSEWTKGSGMTFKAGAKGNKDDEDTLDHFTGLKGDGKLIDTKYYTAKKGSVKIEIDPEYLETLEVGKHVLTLMFDDADDVEITFTVLAAKEETSKDAKVDVDDKSKASNDAKVDVDDKSKASNDASTDKATESKTDKVANTGDNAQPLLALFVMIDAALALNYVLLRKRRDKKN